LFAYQLALCILHSHSYDSFVCRWNILIIFLHFIDTYVDINEKYSKYMPCCFLEILVFLEVCFLCCILYILMHIIDFIVKITYHVYFSVRLSLLTVYFSVFDFNCSFSFGASRCASRNLYFFVHCRFATCFCVVFVHMSFLQTHVQTLAYAIKFMMRN